MDLNGIGKFAKDLAKGVGSPAIAAWDLATAPWNDAEEFNGFWNTLKTTGSRFATNVVTPIANVAAAPGVRQTLSAIDNINNTLIRRPLTTFQLVAGKGGLEGVKEQFDPESWKRAWASTENSETGITFGQAFSGESVAAIQGKKQFDIYDEKQRDEVFRKNLFGKTVSGTIDAGVLIFGDVTIGAGKAVKAFRESGKVTNKIESVDDAMTAAQEIRRAASGEQNKYTRILDDFANNDTIYAYNHPMVKSASARGLLAHSLGNAKNPQEAAEVIAAGLGDPAAMDALMARRADLGMALQRAQGEMDAFQARKAWAGPGSLFEWEDEAIASEKAIELDAVRKNYDYVDKLVTLAKTSESGNIKRTTGEIGAIQKFDNFLADRRSRAFYESESRFKPVVDFFQATPFHTPVKVVRYPFHERPSGLVDLNDANSSQEIVANVTQALNLANGSRSGKYAKHVEATGSGYRFKDSEGIEHFYDSVNEERARSLVDAYLGAATPEARSKAVLNLEESVFTAIAGKHGIDKDSALGLFNKWQNARTSALQSLKHHSFAVDMDGSTVLNPLFESQTANFLPLMDFALVDKVLGKHGMPDALRKVRGVGEEILHYTDVANDLFKLGALLRFGYTIRNGVEAQLRIAASTGSFGSLAYLGEGAKNLMVNTGRRGSRVIDRIRGVAGPKAYAAAKKSYEESVTQTKALEKRIKELDAEIATTKTPAAIAERNILASRLDDHKKIVQTNSAAMSKMEQSGKVAGIGQGQFKVASKYTLADGTNAYVVDDAFGGLLGDMWQRSVSVEGSLNRFINDNAHLVGNNMASEGYGAVMPADPQYWTEWANTLNTAFRNSKVAMRFADGWTPDKIKRWLLANEDGIAVRKALDLSPNEIDEYVNVAQQIADMHMPNAEVRALLKSGETITPEQLRAVSPDLEALKPIHGNIVVDNLERLSDKTIKPLVNGAFRFLGTIPEDRWARNPLYVSLYRDAMRMRVARLEDMRKGPLTQEDMLQIYKSAHQDALSGVKSTLFNIDRKTNAAYTLRLIAPFFSAYENAVKSWAKMAYDKPQLVMRGYYAFTAPNRMGIATDQNGNPVPVEKASIDDVMWLSIPKGMQMLPGMDSLTEMGISKRSLDVLFGGDFNIPFGPYVAIPVSAIVKDRPDLEDTLKWAIPFGPATVSSMLPTWARRQLQKQQGEDNSTYNNFFNLIYQTEMQKWRERGGEMPGNPMPTMKDIKGKTNAYYNLHSFANLVLPFAPRFNSPYRFYIDKYHEYQQTFGADAAEKFLNQYGETYFGFTSSLSRNTTGSQASVSSVQIAKRYPELIGALKGDDAKLIGLITNNPDGYTFSEAAYRWQQENAVAPGSSTKFREKSDPAEADRLNQAQLGWIKYRKAMTMLEQQLSDRGLASFQQRGAEDLAEMKNLAIVAIESKHPAWYDDYLDTDGSKTRRIVRGLSRIVTDEKFMKDNGGNPTWKSVVAYLSARQMMQQYLVSREAKSIDAKSNGDLKEMWDLVVMTLKAEDGGFSDLYDRFLSQDQVWDKVEVASK